MLKMLYLKQRDCRLLRFIKDFGVADTQQIKRLFFSDVTMRRCCQRLKLLVGDGRLQRQRDYVSQKYIYFVDKKPKEIQHMLTRVEFYIQLQSQYRLCEFEPEYPVGDLRADAYFEIYRNGYALPYFLEVQISPYFRQEKYDKYYAGGSWLDKWEQFPKVIVVSDNKIRYKPSNVDFVQIGGEMNDKLIKRIDSML
jgi:hypothetical protein